MMTVSRLGPAAALAAALALAPLAAEANDERRGPRWLDHHRHSQYDERNERHERHERRERHERHERYERARFHPHVRHHGHWCPSRHQHHARSPFWCDPCGAGFGHLAAFHSHVHHHHHVPWAFLPHVVIQVGFGWVFHG